MGHAGSVFFMKFLIGKSLLGYRTSGVSVRRSGVFMTNSPAEMRYLYLTGAQGCISTALSGQQHSAPGWFYCSAMRYTSLA